MKSHLIRCAPQLCYLFQKTMGLCISTSTAVSSDNKSYLLQTLDEHEGRINCAALSEDR